MKRFQIPELGKNMDRSAIVAVLRHPTLWPEALRTYLAMTRRRWWRQPPFLPLPDEEYMSWRRMTAYGDADRPIEERDVVAYLQWRRRQRRRG